jgi:chaperonin GroES
MKVKPLADRVLVKVEEGETKTSGGIIIPQTAQEKTQTGIVVAVGPGKETEKGKEPITVSVGQKVMYDKYAGTQVKIDSVEHLIVKMADIIAVIE